MLGYFYGTLNQDTPSHKLVEYGPRLDGEIGQDVYRLLASAPSLPPIVAAAQLLGPHFVEHTVAPCIVFDWKLPGSADPIQVVP